MKTIVYIDGFNLYKGALTSTPYKWLDINKLFSELIIRPIVPESEVIQLKFFTAKLKGAYCKNPESPQRQHKYLLALEKHLSEYNIQVIEGKHSLSQKQGKVIHPSDNSHFDGWAIVEGMEEKQTDVNIALNMYRDCSQGMCEHAVLVSNDSDLAPALEHIEVDFPEIMRGVIIPNSNRRSESLIKHASWKRVGINEDELKNSQLPNMIEYKTGKRQKIKQILKPADW